jgi:hypothetical protein
MAQTRAKREAKARGVWEREPGSGVYWIRFRDADGKLRREKVGARVTPLTYSESARRSGELERSSQRISVLWGSDSVLSVMTSCHSRKRTTGTNGTSWVNSAHHKQPTRCVIALLLKRLWGNLFGRFLLV